MLAAEPLFSFNCFHRNTDDRNLIVGPGRAIHLYSGDLIHNIHTLDYLSKDGMGSIQPRGTAHLSVLFNDFRG